MAASHASIKNKLTQRRHENQANIPENAPAVATPVAGSKRPARDMSHGDNEPENIKRLRGDGQISGIESSAKPTKGVFSAGVPATQMQSTRITHPTGIPPAIVNGVSTLASVNPPTVPVMSGQRLFDRQALPSLREVGYMATGLERSINDTSPNRFRPGHLIYCNQHVTAQDPSANPYTDPNVVQSPKAAISSKFRLGVVLHIHADGSIFVLPGSSHSGNDLDNLSPFQKRNLHMVLQLRGDKYRSNPTNYDPLNVDMFGSRSIGRKSSVCLTEGFSIKANEKVDFVGRLSASSTKHVLRRHARVTNDAEDDAARREKGAARRAQKS